MLERAPVFVKGAAELPPEEYLGPIVDTEKLLPDECGGPIPETDPYKYSEALCAGLSDPVRVEIADPGGNFDAEGEPDAVSKSEGLPKG